MRKTLILTLALAAMGMGGAIAAPAQMRMQSVRLRPMTVVVLPGRVTPRFAVLAPRLTPRGAGWVAAESKRLRSGAIDPSAVGGDARQMCGVAFSTCSGNADIEALCFIVMMQASSDAEQDLRTIMDGVKKTNNSKAAMREGLQARHNISAEELNREQDALKNELDSMSDMGEMDAMRLQMAMDRVSKFMTALSNVEKKMADTQSGITGNLK